MTSLSSEALHAANRRGVLAVTAGMACFVANDTIVKYVSESMPSSQLIFLRGVMASVLVLALAQATGAARRIGDLMDGRVVLRAIVDALGTIVYLVALFHIPLADASAINNATPLVVAVLAVAVFRERVSAWRWLAICVGFAGVLLVVQPTGTAFNAFSLLCLGGTVLQALRDFATRMIRADIPSLLVTLSTAVSVTLFAGAWGLFEPWRHAEPWQLGALAAAGVFLSGGYYFFIVAMRQGELTLVAPFRYSGLLYAVLLGYAIWGEVPGPLAWLGIVLIVGSGLYLMSDRRKP
jgi:drug/metabolite transporter (DMT)-like permease